MRLEEIATPVGPEPVGVYWRRRLIAVGLVILMLFVITRCTGGGAKKKASNSKPTVTTSSSPSARAATQPPTTTTTTAACQTNDLKVSADADGADYSASQNPKITISITNNGSQPCLLDTSKRSLTISSGGDLWYSSAACPSGTQDKPTLAPKQVLKSSYTWNRKRLATSCTPGETAPTGTYLAQAHYDTIVTPGAVIRLH